MKTYRNLYKEVISDENIELAIQKACKNKKKNRYKAKKLKRLKENPKRVEIVRDWIENYERRICKPKEIYDGIGRKKRYIYVPTVKETVVQHALVQVLDKYLTKGMYVHAYAAIPGRGQHKAKKVIVKWVRVDKIGTKYYLKMDIKQYFPSVSQDKLMKMFERQVKDHRVVKLMRDIIGACDEGIPLGYYISQWIANYYLMKLDHRICEDFKCAHFTRWMDDMVIFDSSKEHLHYLKNKIAESLKEFGLELKSNWIVARFVYWEHPFTKKHKGQILDFMGFRFYRNRTTLRRSLWYKIKHKAKKIGLKEKMTLHDIRQFLSYLGWLKCTDTYEAYSLYVAPYVKISEMKKRVSISDRREHKLLSDKEKENDNQLRVA